MADNIKWIKIVTNIFDDEKMKLIDAMPDNDAILVIWFKLLVQAGKSNYLGALCLNENIPYSEEMLASLFNRKIQVVRLALQTFESLGMIERSDVIQIANWDKHQNTDGMERIKEQNRLRVAKFRATKTPQIDCNVTGNVTVTQCNAIDIDIELDKERDKDIKTRTKEDKTLAPQADAVSVKVVKNRYGTFKNVLLTKEENEKLHLDYQNADELIEYLSNHIEMKGYKAKSHNLAIRKWVSFAIKEEAIRKARLEGSTQSNGYGKPRVPDIELPWLEDYIASQK
jgi:predicted phage replisome organizer